MSELFFAWFLVVSELRGDGGHVSSRMQMTPGALALSFLGSSDSYKPEAALAYVISPHLSCRQHAKIIMGIKHFDSKRHLSLDRPPAHTASRLPDRRETHPVFPAFHPFRHEARHRRRSLPPVHLRELAWKGASALRNRRSPSRPHTTHRNRPQDPRKASNQTRLRFFRPHPPEALETRPATPNP